MIKDNNQSRLKDLERLICKEQDRLFRFAYMRTGNRPDAEDIVQEVFLKLFQSNEKLGYIRTPKHYLLRAVSNACNDYLRRRRYNLVPIEQAIHAIAEEDSDIHDEYIRISALLESLPEEQAEIVRLRCSDGLKFREIADLINVPEATAKSRYRYAIAHIQEKLNK
ncbi:MAG: sigma-70 family RNA polymerase sigma factor [Bacteroidales bacterium]|nr:sigma-70 family RNA polymerase sigma factor [Bacteroidales bacterium]